jgi:hypothetical protein
MSDQPTNGQDKEQARRFDGWMNTLGGHAPWSPERPIGGENSIYHNMTRFWQNQHVGNEAEVLYHTNGIAAVIVDRPADECFSKRIEIEGDDDEVMMGEYDRLSVAATFADALRWSRLFGSSAILMMIKDGGGWEDPLNLDTIDTVEDLVVYDQRYIKPTNKLYTDSTDPKFGKPEWYKIKPPGGNEFECHETRMIPFSGDPLPLTNNRGQTLPWWHGKSALACCKDDIIRLMSAYYWTVKLLERKQQGIYKMEGLGDLFAQEMDHIVSKRINLVDHVRNILNSVVVDAKDEFTVLNLGLDGLNNVIGELQIAVCASSKFPSVILFGKSSTSLNATGAGELELYYGMVNLLRTKIAGPALEQLTAILWLQKSLGAKAPDDWKIVFQPIWMPSAKEQADTKLVEAQARAAEVTMLVSLMDAMILTPEELRKILATKYLDYELPETVTIDLTDQRYANSAGGGPNDPGQTGSGRPAPQRQSNA